MPLTQTTIRVCSAGTNLDGKDFDFIVSDHGGEANVAFQMVLAGQTEDRRSWT